MNQGKTAKAGGLSCRIAQVFAAMPNCRQQSFSLPRRRNKALSRFLDDLTLAERKGRECKLQFD